MTVAKHPDAYNQGETPSWAWPVHAFVAWLATILDYITRFKRARRFAPNWRDNWEGLRECEWHRDQLIAQGVAQLLARQPLQFDDTKIQLTPPASYGGPCPRTPFDMSRRFIALARWAADPEAIIRKRHKRLSRILRVAHGSTDALRAAHHEAVGVAASRNANARVALMVSSARSARPSNHEGGLTYARGPPTFSDCLLPTAYCLGSASFRDRPRLHAIRNRPIHHACPRAQPFDFKPRPSNALRWRVADNDGPAAEAPATLVPTDPPLTTSLKWGRRTSGETT